MVLKNLQEKRAKVARKIKEIHDDAEGRDFTPEEQESWDNANGEYNALTRSIRTGEIEAEQNEIVDSLIPMDGAPDPRRSGGIPDSMFYGGNSSRSDGMTFRNAATGQTVRARRHGQSLVDRNADGPPLDVGRCLTSLVNGRVEDLPAEERAALLGASQTGGGYLLNSQLSTQIVDLARAASVTMRAGAQTIPMATSELAIAKVASDPTGHWRPETTAIAASTVGFERVTLRAKTLACLVPISIELAEDASNASQAVVSVIQKALATELDRVVLEGSGAENEPRGIINTSGVNTIGSVGTPSDWTNPSAAVGDILGANYPGKVSGLSWVQNPAVAEVYDGLTESSTGAPLRPTPWASQLQRFYTTAQASDVDIVGDFSQVLVGMRTTGVVVQLLDAGTAADADGTTWNATSQMLRWIRCYLRADVAILQPSWFTVSSGITLS